MTLRHFFCLGLCLSLGVVRLQAITWTGAGDGRAWSEAANWDEKRVPGPADDVLIPRTVSQVELTGGVVAIRALTAPGGVQIRSGTLRLTQGESRFGGKVTLSAGAILEGTGLSVLVVVDGAPTEWSGDVRALRGAKVILNAVTEIRGESPDWRVDGVGSLIDARSVTNIALGTRGWFPIEARNEGRVDLSKLGAVRGAIWPKAYTGGEIDLSGVRGRWTTEGFTYAAQLLATGGGRVLLPGLTSLDRVEVTVDRTGDLAVSRWDSFTRSTLNLSEREWVWGNVTNVDDSTLRLKAGAVLKLPSLMQVRGTNPDWRAEDPGTWIDARSVTNFGLASRGWFPIEARNEARVDLSGLRSLRGAIWPKAYSGGEIDFSGVRGRWTTEGFTYRAELLATGAGRVLLPGVTSLDRVEVTLDGTGVLPITQWEAFTRCTLNLSGRELVWRGVVNVDDSALRLEEGAVLRLPALTNVRGTTPSWIADDFGTLLDAGSVTNIGLDSRGWFPIEARNEARVNLSGVGALRGPVWPKAFSRGEIDLSGVRGRWSTEGFTYAGELVATGEGRVLLPGLTGLDRLNVTVDTAVGVPMAQWTSFTRSTLNLSDREVVWAGVTNVDDATLRLEGGAVLRLPALTQVRGTNPDWKAEGFGTRIEARSVSELELATRGWFPILAQNEAHVDLSGVRKLQGPIWPKVVSGGVIDLSGVRGVWSTEGFTYQGELAASGNGRIRIPGVVGLERFSITLESGGRIDTEQLESLRNSTVVVGGFETVLALGSLRDQTGTTFRTSNGGQVVFALAPRIVASPVGRRLRPGASWVLQVEAEGDAPLSYRWYKNGQRLEGEASATLRLDNVDVSDAGSYTVMVGNPAGLTPSEPALVTMDVPEWPFGDTFARRGQIVAKEGVGIGSNAEATLDGGEPTHANKQGGKSIWLTWRAPESGVATFATTGSNFDTLLAVYRGATLAALTSNRVVSDDDGGGFFTSRVVFNAVAGTDYEIAVDGYAGVWGDVVLSWTLDPALPALPEILQPPADVLAVEGRSAQFNVTAGPADVTYQWFKNRAVLAGRTGATLTIASVSPADAGAYAVEVRTPAGAAVRSSEARLEVVDRVEDTAGLSADKLDDLFLDDASGGSVRSLLFRGRTAAGGGVGVGLPGGQWTDNSQSTRSSSDPVVCEVATSATRWFRLRLKVPAVDAFTLHTEGSEIPAFLAVFTNRTALTLLACDSAVVPLKPAARVTFPARAGVDYLVLVDGVDGALGRIRLNWALEEEEVPVQRPELSFDAGRLVIQMYPLPGLYDWQMGSGLTGWQTLFRTNLAVGNFRYVDPEPATAPTRFFWLKPALP